MAAGGEAENADALRVDLPSIRARPDPAHGTLSIEQRRRVVIPRRDPVLQDERADTDGVEPARDVVALVPHREVAVAAPRADHDGDSDVVVGGCRVQRQK